MKDEYHLDSHKLFWHLEDVSKVQKGQVISPLYLEVSPVSFCNHKCNFCGKDFVQEPGYKISLEKFEEFIAFVASVGTKSLMFAGEGEPMLHPQIYELIEICKRNNLDVSMTTNGSQGNIDIWEKVLPMLSWIRFSVNGATAQTYSTVHNTKLAEFNKVFKSIEEALFVKNKYKLDVTIGIQFVVLTENFEEIDLAIKTFSEINADYISFKPFSRSPQMLSDKEENYSEEVLKKVYELESIGKVGNTIVNVRGKAFETYAQKNVNFSRCHGLNFWGYLKANGDFYTCPIHIGNSKFKTGNLNANTPKEIIFGQQRCNSLKFAKEELDTKLTCRVNCRLARINEFLEEIAIPPKHVNFI